MQAKLQTILNSVTPLSEASINQIFEAIEYRPIKKGVDFIKVGAKNNLEYFILEGVCKSFLRTQEGDEVTISVLWKILFFHQQPREIRMENRYFI